MSTTPVVASGLVPAPGREAGPADSAATIATSSIPFLNLSISLANKLHTSLLNQTSGGYFYSASSNWTTITSAQYSTLGNAFIVAGLLQLYQATGNQTYLLWASSTSQEFWTSAWASGPGGFYDTYNPNWSKSTCEEIAQDNAMFEIDFLNLYRLNGSSGWLQDADSVEQVLNDRFWNVTDDIVEVGYSPCTNHLSGDVDIETSIGSYLWATGEWTSVTDNSSYLARMNTVASFAHRYLWDGSSKTVQGGPDSTDCGGTGGSLGFMRSIYANLTGLEDCRKGANENIWGAMGLAELYGLTGNSTLLNWTNEDLAWINDTLWDPIYGGYHNDVFQNDTLRSSCSSTNDPRDYPGWTQGEQPMFWWNIGALTDNITMMRWSLVSETWTAHHQWNYTYGNGGDMTCLNGNTLPDPGSPYLYDWIQGSVLYSFSTIGPIQISNSSYTSHSSVAQSSASMTSSSTNVGSNGRSTTQTAAKSLLTTYVVVGALGLIGAVTVGVVLYVRGTRRMHRYYKMIFEPARKVPSPVVIGSIPFIRPDF